MSNFISLFCHYTDQSESPRSFFLWGGIAALAAVCRDNIYHEWTYNRTYPNVYILLIAPPALGKKTPMTISGELIRAVGNTKIIAGSASIQAVIRRLGTYETGGHKGASCILYSEELSSFYATDSKTNELLTDLWDYHKKWDRDLISWSASLNDVCVTMFAATNETLLKNVFDAAAIYGGLLSRTMLVVEKRKRRKDAMIRQNTIDVKKEDHDKLVTHLKNLSKLRGIIQFDDKAVDEFEDWYNNQWDELTPKTKTGIEGRMKTHVKKVSMLLAMSEWNLDLVIRRKHVEEAIELCTGLYKNYQIISMEGGSAPTAHPAALLIRLLINAKDHEMARTTILRRNIGELSPAILDETVGSMKEAELLLEMNCNNSIYYRLTNKALELYGDAEKEVKK